MHFFTKKKFFFCKIFLIFEFFSNSEAWLQNLRLVNDFSEYSGLFDTYIGLGSAFVEKWEIYLLKLLVCKSSWTKNSTHRWIDLMWGLRGAAGKARQSRPTSNQSQNLAKGIYNHESFNAPINNFWARLSQSIYIEL